MLFRSLIQRGVCWSKSVNPTISEFKIIDSVLSLGNYTCNLTNLIAGVTYYARAYATNRDGTAYGNQISFTTTQPSLPLLTTTKLTEIAVLNATSGGEIISDGGSEISYEGICWSKTINPTIADHFTQTSASQGLFISSFSVSEYKTTYYVRAYATNSVGTAYGNQVTFTSGGLSIGDNYQGGIIGYILVSGDLNYVAGETHGLIYTPDINYGAKAQWGCEGTSISGALGTEIGTGKQNTLSIINGCKQSGTAAMLCYNYESGGYSDWYLPSKKELESLGLTSAYGTFYYWSSTQISPNMAWFCVNNVGSGGSLTNLKSTSYRVCAVRSF